MTSKADYKPIKAPGRGPGGWYCDSCGYTTTRLPIGHVVCRRCGGLGLLGFAGKSPARVFCGQDGCTRLVWIDGVNSCPASLRRLHMSHLEAVPDAR